MVIARFLLSVVPLVALLGPSAANAAAGNPDAVALIEAHKGQSLKKDEFETTSAHQQRIKSFSGQTFTLVVDAKGPRLGPKPLTYDADTETLTVRLIGDDSIPAYTVLESGSGLTPQEMLSTRYVRFKLESRMKEPQQFQAQNAMGAQTIATRLVGTEWFVGILNLQAPGLTSKTQAGREVRIKVPADQARKLAGGARWRLYVESAVSPGQKGFVVESGLFKKATIDEPTEIAIAGPTLMALLRRAELLHGDSDEPVTIFDFATDKAGGSQAVNQALVLPDPSVPQAELSMLSSLASRGKVVAFVRSNEQSGDARSPSAAVLGIACTSGKLIVTVGTEFPIKKTWSITPPLTDVRYAFDADDNHYNWQQFSPIEAGPMGFTGSFLRSLSEARALRVAFEVDGQAERRAVTFNLAEPRFRERYGDAQKSCR